jgi:hypothetical protein
MINVYVANTLRACFALDDDAVEALTEIVLDMADEDGMTPAAWLGDRGNFTTVREIADDKVESGNWLTH